MSAHYVARLKCDRCDYLSTEALAPTPAAARAAAATLGWICSPDQGEYGTDICPGCRCLAMEGTPARVRTADGEALPECQSRWRFDKCELAEGHAGHHVAYSTSTEWRDNDDGWD